MTNVIYRKQNPDSGPEQGSWLAVVAVGLVVAAFTFGFIGLPSAFTDEPPPGVELYEDGNLLCWDKVVCCNPADKSTCATIPICRMNW